MLSALVSLPRGAARDLLMKELRRLGVRVVEFSDAKEAAPAVDFVVVGSDAAHATLPGKILGVKRSRLPVIMVQTSRLLHESPGYDKDMLCLHRPVQACLIHAYVRSIMDRKKLSDRLTRLLGSSKSKDGHVVDDLWFAVFERLQEIQKMKAGP